MPIPDIVYQLPLHLSLRVHPEASVGDLCLLARVDAGDGRVKLTDKLLAHNAMKALKR